jgi:hypothetical protein
VWSCHEALAFGRRTVSANILRLGWDPRDSAPSLTDRLLHRRAVRRPKSDDEPVAEPAEARPKSATPAEAVATEEPAAAVVDAPAPPDETKQEEPEAPPALPQQ